MKTLKELVDCQKLTRQDDISIIKNWFIENNMESEGLSIVTELAKSQASKLQNTLNRARSWLPYLPDIEKANKELTPEQARNIQSIITIHLLGMDLKDSNYYDWAKEEIPKIKLPKVIFVPCVEWLEEKYEIKFMKNNLNKK